MPKSKNVNIQITSGSTTIFIVFLLLRVFGVVDWSWWIVTAPLWFGWAVYLAFLVGALLFAGLIMILVLIGDWMGHK